MRSHSGRSTQQDRDTLIALLLKIVDIIRGYR
jgi:hypothetical protein